MAAKKYPPLKFKYTRSAIDLLFNKNSIKAIWSRLYKNLEKFPSFPSTKSTLMPSLNLCFLLTWPYRFLTSFKLSVIYWGFLYVGANRNNNFWQSNFFLRNSTPLQRLSEIIRLHKNSTQSIKFILHVLRSSNYPKR